MILMRKKENIYFHGEYSNIEDSFDVPPTKYILLFTVGK